MCLFQHRREQTKINAFVRFSIVFCAMLPCVVHDSLLDIRLVECLKRFYCFPPLLFVHLSFFPSFVFSPRNVCAFQTNENIFILLLSFSLFSCHSILVHYFCLASAHFLFQCFVCLFFFIFIFFSFIISCVVFYSCFSSIFILLRRWYLLMPFHQILQPLLLLILKRAHKMCPVINDIFALAAQSISNYLKT